MPHEPEDLRLASNKLDYHVMSYRTSFLWWVAHAERNKGPTPESNAMLDSHLVHARVLIYFLLGKKFPETDVNASDFLDDASTFVPLISPTLDNWREKINRRLVHLTVHDLKELISETEWDFDEIARELVPRLKDFLNPSVSTKIEDKDRRPSLEYLAELDPYIK